MQMSRNHGKLQNENLLETTGELQLCRIKTERDLLQSHACIIPEQQATRASEQEDKSCVRKRKEAGLSRLVPRLLRTE